MPYQHTPVLHDEVLDALQPAPGKFYIDCTVGGGGHAAALLERIQPGGQLFGIDADPAALTAAQARFKTLSALVSPPTAWTLVQGNFAQLATLAAAHGYGETSVDGVDGIVFDLGVSSYQLETPERGFSFQGDGPLDMRLDPTQGETAADLVATRNERELADIIYRYGEERFSRRIARAIVARRSKQPIATTGDLASLVQHAIYGQKGAPKKRHAAIHPATRTFQALRIAVNQELASLEAALPQAVALLRPGGRLAVISFHSLEDRIVKHFFRAESGYGGNEADGRPVRVHIVTRKPITASDQEQQANPRSRSAKLRVAERIHVETSKS